MLKGAVFIDPSLFDRAVQLNPELFCCLEIGQKLLEADAFPIKDISAVVKLVRDEARTLHKYGIRITPEEVTAELPSGVLPLENAADFLTKAYLALRSAHQSRSNSKLEAMNFKPEQVVELREVRK